MDHTKKHKRLVDILKPLIAESMGKQAGELFHKFYELEDDDEVMRGARGLLYELMGGDMAEKKLKEVMSHHES